MYAHWYCEPQNIFSAALVIATIGLVVANIKLWKSQEKMLKKQEELMKLNIITNISHGLYLENTFTKKYTKTLFKPIIKAIPNMEDEIRDWYQEVELFKAL